MADYTRLAPSPTGALHLGNARTFLLNFLLARTLNWRILCRIDDLDGPRVKPGADRDALDDLRFLGITWDVGPVYQSHRLEHYRAAAARLLEQGHAYPCTCSRAEVESAASAPHASDGATPYPGTCRGRYRSLDDARASGKPACLRFRFDAPPVAFHDQLHGDVRIDPTTLGDFPILKADGTPAYQLACAIDDAEDGITRIVRGDDLLDSTPRQLAVQRALRLPDHACRFYHLPLVVGPDGRRLAKRHGDTRIATYRQLGVTAGRLLRLLARWSGIPWPHARDPETADDLLPCFDPDRLPTRPTVFTDDDHRFLLGRHG
ncbi:MAG: tRNA glutamyl-Q(34) synthetase GluQRS [Tepidisphaerales bacterium]